VKQPFEKECAGPRKRGSVAESDRSRMVEALTQTTAKGDQHMSTHHKFVGLDVHKDTTVVTVAEGGREGEVRQYGTLSSDLHALERLSSATPN